MLSVQCTSFLLRSMETVALRYWVSAALRLELRSSGDSGWREGGSDREKKVDNQLFETDHW